MNNFKFNQLGYFYRYGIFRYAYFYFNLTQRQYWNINLSNLSKITKVLKWVIKQLIVINKTNILIVIEFSYITLETDRKVLQTFVRGRDIDHDNTLIILNM